MKLRITTRFDSVLPSTAMTGQNYGRQYLCVFDALTAGSTEDDIGSDEEEIISLIHLIIDVEQAKVRSRASPSIEVISVCWNRPSPCIGNTSDRRSWRSSARNARRQVPLTKRRYSPRKSISTVRCER